MTCPALIMVVTVILSVVGFYTPDLAHPWITTVNLVGGMLLAALLYWYLLNFNEGDPGERTTMIALCRVFAVIVTGAWVSASLAAIGCDGLFSCSIAGASADGFNPLRVLEFVEGEFVPSGDEGVILLVHQLTGLVAIAALGFMAVVRLKASAGRSLLPVVLMLSLVGVIVAEHAQRSVELASLHNILSLCLLLILIQQYRRWDGN